MLYIFDNKPATISNRSRKRGNNIIPQSQIFYIFGRMKYGIDMSINPIFYHNRLESAFRKSRGNSIFRNGIFISKHQLFHQFGATQSRLKRKALIWIQKNRLMPTERLLTIRENFIVSGCLDARLFESKITTNITQEDERNFWICFKHAIRPFEIVKVGLFEDLIIFTVKHIFGGNLGIEALKCSIVPLIEIFFSGTSRKNNFPILQKSIFFGILHFRYMCHILRIFGQDFSISRKIDCFPNRCDRFFEKIKSSA